MPCPLKLTELLIRLCTHRPTRRHYLAVTRVDCIKTAEHNIKILSLSHSSFPHQGLLRKSDGFTPHGGAEYKRFSTNMSLGYILETVISHVQQLAVRSENAAAKSELQSLTPLTELHFR